MLKPRKGNLGVLKRLHALASALKEDFTFQYSKRLALSVSIYLSKRAQALQILECTIFLERLCERPECSFVTENHFGVRFNLSPVLFSILIRFSLNKGLFEWQVLKIDWTNMELNVNMPKWEFSLFLFFYGSLEDWKLIFRHFQYILCFRWYFSHCFSLKFIQLI